MIRSVVLHLGIVFLSSAFAQSTSPGKLITLNLAATNSREEPISDLQLTDLQLREDGKPRPIVFFHFAGSARSTPASAPNEFANHPTLAPLVILLDRWNERLIVSGKSGIDLGAAIQSLESVSNIYIYFLTNTGDLVPVHPLPTTAADLRAAPDPSPAALRAELDEGIRNYQGFRSRDDLGIRIQKTFQALDALRVRMAPIAGRKSLVWVTQGLPLTFRTRPGNEMFDLTPQVRDLSERAAQSQVAIYTVDQTLGVGTELSRTLQMFSALTGGRWYSHDNAAQAFAGALVEARGSYRIAYYSGALDKEGKQYKIRVDTERKGVHLSYRDAFTIEPAHSRPDESEAAVFDNQRRSPFDASEIGVRVAMSRTPAARAIHFDIHVDPADVLIEQAGDRYRAMLDVVIAPYNEGVTQGTSSATRLDLNLTRAQFDQAAKEGISFPMDAPASDVSQKLRIIVLDPRLDAFGSVTIPAK